MIERLFNENFADERALFFFPDTQALLFSLLGPGLGECVQRMNTLVLAVLLIRDEIEVSFEVRFRCFVPTDQEALFPPHRELSPR